MKDVSAKTGKVWCEWGKTRGQLDFFFSNGTKAYWLFSSNAAGNLRGFYSNGLTVAKAIDKTMAPNSFVLKVMEKLPKYLRYIEQEENEIILEKTARRAAAAGGYRDDRKIADCRKCRAYYVDRDEIDFYGEYVA